MRGIYIKKVLGITTLLMISLIIAGYVIANKKFTAKETSSTKALAAHSSNLEYRKDGCIFKDQNDYFIKYTFACKDNVQALNKIEDSKSITLKISKAELPVAAFSTQNNSKENKIHASSDKINQIITIYKNYPENNFVYIDSLNSKNIIVLVSRLKNPYQHKIVLDPGHGGIDAGANVEGLYEKNLTLKIVKFIPEFLRYYGFKITFTREMDKFLDYKHEIPDIVNSSNADLFVSIHINSFTNQKEHGIGVYYYAPDSTQKSDRINLASDIAREVTKSDNWYNRGIFSENYCVLRKSNIPCALVECGFISNPEDRSKLQDDNVLKRLAYNISTGIEKYIKK